MPVTATVECTVGTEYTGSRILRHVYIASASPADIYRIHPCVSNPSITVMAE